MKQDARLHKVRLKCLVYGADKILLDADNTHICDICGKHLKQTQPVKKVG